jgi:hypothetical protein
VPADADGGQGVLSHFALPMPELEDNKRGTRWFHGWAGAARQRGEGRSKRGNSFSFGGLLAHFALTQACQWL